MSHENVEIARAFMRAFNAGDADALVACCHPEAEFHSSFAAIGGANYRGHDEVRRWYRDIVGEWGDAIRAEAEAFFDLGEQVLVYTLVHGQGHETHVEVDLTAAMLLRIRDRRIVYFRGYTHREDALEDVGISEDALPPIAP